MNAKKKLEKAGWREVSRVRRGMYVDVKWRDPLTGIVWPQGYSLEILRLRKQVEDVKRSNDKRMRGVNNAAFA
jgi:hypothetical protein